MIDLHCHLLPGVDDGPRDLETALAMARLHVAAGVDTVAVTPHVRHDGGVQNDGATVARAVEELREALRDAGIPLAVVPGGEIDMPSAADMSDDELRALALGGSRWLLVEAPLLQFAHVERAVQMLLSRGHLVLLAHPERSPVLQREPDIIRRLVHAGVTTQLTAGSLAGQFGRTVQRFCEQLLDERLVHVVASDAHDAGRRPPGLLQPLLDGGLASLAPALTHDVPAAILADEPIPAVPARPKRRGLRSLLGR